MNTPERLPPGWTESQIRDVIAHYDNQTEDEEAEEIEAAFNKKGMTSIVVPTELVAEIRSLIARKQVAQNAG